MAGDGVGHERPAAHVAVGAVELLPQMLDARRVLAVEQLEQRLGQGAGDLRLQAGDLAPAGDLVVGLDLDVGLRPNGKAVQRGDADAGRFVLRDLAGRIGGEDFGGDAGDGDGAGRGQHVATGDRIVFHDVLHRRLAVSRSR